MRRHRMLGRRTKWILGTDHAGIATQKQVESALEAEGTSREAIGREAFVERVWGWREQYGGQIIDQFKRLGATCDYDDERFTLDEGYARAVLKVFVSLYQQGLVYRDHYLVNWDPGSGSAISDLEVEEREVTDTLFHIAYPLATGGEPAVRASSSLPRSAPRRCSPTPPSPCIPTTSAYRGLVGGEAVLPLVGRHLPVIADDYVKPDFGTGALKITPGHDPNDFEIGPPPRPRRDLRHRRGRPHDARGRPGVRGLHGRRGPGQGRGGARRPGPHPPPRAAHVTPCPSATAPGERIEPLISLQWFMRMEALAAPAIEVVREGRVRIHPESQRRRYLDWLENIRPWCISPPAVVGPPDPGLVSRATGRPTSAPSRRRARAGARPRRARHVVLARRCGPSRRSAGRSDTDELRAFYPTDVLSTARDILFLWVARMVMMGLRFAGDVPFADVYVHSVIQAPDGRRMSKSLGTGIDPLDEIEAHGADAVRFGLLAMSSSQDVRYSEREGRAGPGAGQQALQRDALRAAQRRPGRRGRATAGAPSTTAGSCRACRPRRPASRAHRGLRLRQGRARPLRLRLRRALRLVPRVPQGPRVRRRALRDRPARAARDAAARAPDHPVRHRGALGAPARHGGPARAGAGHGGRRDAARRRGPRRRSARSIHAVRAVRSWRDEAGVRPGQVVGARVEGLDGGTALVARLARLDLERDGEATAAAARSRRPRGDPRGRPRRRRGGGSQAGGGARAPRGRDRPCGAQARQRGLRRQGARPPSSRPSATSSIASAAELEALVTRRWLRRRALPARARALRHALRPGPDAPPDDRARLTAGALRLRPRRRHERQVVDDAHDRRDPARATGCAPARTCRRTSSRSPSASGSTTPTSTPERFAAAVQRARTRGRAGRPHAGRGRPRDPVRGAHRGRLRRARRGAGSTSPSSRPGLGGRYDATNVIPSRVQVLTNVGLEHTRWLGPTIADIAGEKLDVVRPGATLVVGADLQPEAVAQAERTCAERGARLVRAPADPGVPVLARGAYPAAQLRAGARRPRQAYLGALDEEAVRAAAASTLVPGRFEVVDAEPDTVLDGAHNPGGMAALAEALPALLDDRRLVAVVSILDDKDAAAMLRELLPLCERGRCARSSSNPRALPAATLASLAASSAAPRARVVPRPARRPRAGARRGRPRRRRAGHGLDLPRRRPPAPGRRRPEVHAVNERGTVGPGDGRPRRGRRRARDPRVLRAGLRVRAAVPLACADAHDASSPSSASPTTPSTGRQAA